MFITNIEVETAHEAMVIAKRELKNVRCHILGLDTMEHNVCQYVVTWLEGADNQAKQAKINVNTKTFEIITEYHSTSA